VRVTPVITRVAQRHWHASEDDLVAGRGEVCRRPDGRDFLSSDPWHSAVLDHLARVVLPALGFGEAAEGPLRELGGVVRAEAEAAVGRQEVPAEVPAGPGGATVPNPAKYAVAGLPGAANTAILGVSAVPVGCAPTLPGLTRRKA
jgi:hypothetical protein